MTTPQTLASPLHKAGVLAVGHELTPLRLDSTDLLVAHTPDPHQIALRHEHGPLTQELGTYEVLDQLPLGWPIRTQDLSERDQHITTRIPRWALGRDRGEVTRHITRPTHLHLLITTASTWQDALGDAARLGHGLPRLAVVHDPRPGQDWGRAVWEADFHDIGLAIQDQQGARTLVAPTTEVHERARAREWAITEQIAVALHIH